VALGAALVLSVRAPLRPTGRDAVRGHRVLGVARQAVRGIDVVLGERRFTARHTASGWETDGRLASPPTADALHDLVETLVGLRSVDAFRARDTSSYGLDRPQATIEVLTPRGVRRVVLGALNSSGSAVYARRSGDPRVLQVGAGLLSTLERVFYTRDGPAPG
jgi:hypothetical protein